VQFYFIQIKGKKKKNADNFIYINVTTIHPKLSPDNYLTFPRQFLKNVFNQPCAEIDSRKQCKYNNKWKSISKK